MLRTFLFLALLAAATDAAHARVPPRMVANVYLLAQAGAMLDICSASPDARSFPQEKTRAIANLSDRLTQLVGAIATHYGDAALPAVYAATKTEIASDSKLESHVKSNHGYCNDRLLGEMRAYVNDNEALIGGHLSRARMPGPARKPGT